MKNKFIFLLALFFATSAFADPSATDKWQRSAGAYDCRTSADWCYFPITGSTSSTALVTVAGTGARMVMNATGVTNGVVFNIVQNVSDSTTPTLAADGQPFTGCNALTADYCVIPPGSYWVEFSTPATGRLDLIPIP